VAGDGWIASRKKDASPTKEAENRRGIRWAKESRPQWLYYRSAGFEFATVAYPIDRRACYGDDIGGKHQVQKNARQIAEDEHRISRCHWLSR
jgi:hypothetical protein